MPDFAQAFARRTRLRGGDELATILAGSPPGVLSMTGGFPNPVTFPTDEVDEIAAARGRRRRVAVHARRRDPERA
jgi:hypothetical protein